MTPPKTKTVHYSGDEPLAPPVGASVNGAPVDSVGIIEKGDSVKVPAGIADSLLERDDFAGKAPSKAKSKAKSKDEESAGDDPADDKMAGPDAADKIEEN